MVDRSLLGKWGGNSAKQRSSSLASEGLQWPIMTGAGPTDGIVATRRQRSFCLAVVSKKRQARRCARSNVDACRFFTATTPA
eukprot:CAMPEP_0115891080 /NCGR_PEP_ID=MMETSP0287-20121206/33679_1 /TAXON_ID=412157 /ORGANISM="Chrysochromulina rotalis, Strain UIO044" /LENGTH=81 /DNA_ID=CAMNT_0003347865 /DNA_START=576 /DNA_END=817 /DNA_ORIENTATION=+